MEDFQEQEYEFLRRLDEERVDRRKLLKRGLATAAGLTIYLPIVGLHILNNYATRLIS